MQKSRPARHLNPDKFEQTSLVTVLVKFVLSLQTLPKATQISLKIHRNLFTLRHFTHSWNYFIQPLLVTNFMSAFYQIVRSQNKRMVFLVSYHNVNSILLKRAGCKEGFGCICFCCIPSPWEIYYKNVFWCCCICFCLKLKSCILWEMFYKNVLRIIYETTVDRQLFCSDRNNL